LIYSNFSINL